MADDESTNPGLLRRRADDLLQANLRSQSEAITDLRDDHRQFREEYTQQIAELRRQQAALRDAIQPVSEWTQRKMEQAQFWKSAREKGLLAVIGVAATVAFTAALEIIRRRFSL